MAKSLIVLCCLFSFDGVFGQFGFFPKREERYGSPLNPNFYRERINRLLHPFSNDRYARPYVRPPDTVVFPTSRPIYEIPDRSEETENPRNIDRPINAGDFEDKWTDKPRDPVVFPDKENLREDENKNYNDKVNDDAEIAEETSVPSLAQETTLSPTTTLTPLIPVTLSPLSPVPPRSNFNFGTEGIFKETCTTSDNEAGTCLKITDCEPLLAIVKKVQSGAQPRAVATDLLRKAHCGFDGNTAKVCCPRPGIPTSPPEVPTTPPKVSSSTTSTTTAAPDQEPKSASEDYSAIFPEPPVCGGGNFSGFRVVGGEDATLGFFPWMTLLGYNRRGSTRWLCGGSLITSRHVLTAAHCIYGHESELYVVRLGELDYSTDADGAHPVDVLIKKSIKHEDYNVKNFENDIGVLLLTGDVKFTDLIQPICLPTDEDLRARSYENYQPIIAGWGNINYQGPASPRLQFTQLPVVAEAACARKFAAHPAQRIDARVLCAGATAGKDACKGDSGGPLMQPIFDPSSSRNFMYQIGIVSYGKGCAFENYPGVYTRVTHFIPWIQTHVANT